MIPNVRPPEVNESKPASQPHAKDGLKSIPMPELLTKLGTSPGGLSQAEAQKRLTHIWSQRD
jgi:H+-transporting ATPase